MTDCHMCLQIFLHKTKAGKRIVGCIKTGPLQLIMEAESRDGREALGKHDTKYRPTYRGRQMASLTQVSHPHLNSSGSDAEYIDKLSEW